MIQTLLGKKIGMTQVYDGDNALVPVTVVEAGPCPVVQVKTVESDGYNAVQLGFGPQKEHRITKSELGHTQKAGLGGLRRLSEIRLAAVPEAKPGDIVTVESFKVGQLVDVVGVSKGKGFQGVVKRCHAQGGPAAHGSMFHRRIGSIGMRQTPGRSWKNQSMPGHMGAERRTVQNLKIVKVVADKNLLLVKGAVPGANGSDLIIRSAVKAVKA